MEQIITNKQEYIKMARDRYHDISKGNRPDGEEDFCGNALLVYHTTQDGFNSHVVEIDAYDAGKDDLGGLLEWAFHDIKDRTDGRFFDDEVYKLMGAVKESELDEDSIKYEEYTVLDCGYVISGLIDYAGFITLTNEHEYIPSATTGDYSPSCPWNAPGMSISDFI